MPESKLRDLSVEFSVKTIKLCEGIKGHSSLINQLERAADSFILRQRPNKLTGCGEG